MANNLSASFEEIWAKEQQTVFYKKNVAMEVADTSFNSTKSEWKEKSLNLANWLDE